MDFKLNQTYKDQLPSDFYSEAYDYKFKSPSLICYNSTLAKFLNLPNFSEQEVINIFTGQQNISRSTPAALTYAGHQFGNFVPRLGDGRAKLLGDQKATNSLNYEIQLKGSGKTAFSRPGSDGLSSLGPVLREYIVSEAMHYLGVPTTRALAAISTGENISRQDGEEPGGVFTRVARSHVRVGTFEYFYAKNQPEKIKQLADYCIKNLYPDAKNELDFFKAVCANHIELVAKWMSLGFIHGVMNTDNTSISGETLDYGPCAFMDEFDFYTKFSFIDRQKRYCYINQAPILQWNLSNLAQCLLPITNEDQHSQLNEEVESVTHRIENRWLELMSQKLGFKEVNIETVKNFLQLMQNHSLDFTLSFRSLSNYINKAPEFEDLYFIESSDAKQVYIDFVKIWKQELKSSNTDLDQLKHKLNQINPVYIPRNHQIQKAIEDGFNDNFDHFHMLNKVLKNPFNKQEGHDLHLPPKPEEVVTTTFCGT